MKLIIIDNNWVKPDRSQGIRMHQSPSCWDCEHLMIGEYPKRACMLFADKDIWSLDPTNEREAFGVVRAEECGHFCLAQELDEDWVFAELDLEDDEWSHGASDNEY